MEASEYILGLAKKARAAAGELAKLDTAARNAALLAMADALEARRDEIGAANANRSRWPLSGSKSAVTAAPSPSRFIVKR